MFETMSSFLWFFIPTLILIIIGIIFEEKLIALESKFFRFAKAVVAGVKMTVKERKGIYGKM